MNNNEFSQTDTKLSTAREEIARRAEELWRQSGSPEGRDEEFWLEAERQLSGTATPATDETRTIPGQGSSPLGGAGGLGVALPSETATAMAQSSPRDAELMKSSGSKGSSGRSRGRKSGGK